MCEAGIDTTKLSTSYKKELEHISQAFPEVYGERLPNSDENNNVDAIIESHASNRTELSPLSATYSSNSAVPVLTPIDGDISYSRKLPKLPAIANANHS